MSKLHKFKPGITASEAAELLSRLIDEQVGEDDIWRLFFDGHLDGFIDCNATIVRTKPLLDPENHKRQVHQGRYIMTTEEDIEFCFGAHLPCFTIEIDGNISATALSDKQGNIYALRCNETREFLNYYDDDQTHINQKFDPAEIYLLAEKANNNEPATVTTKNRVNKWCPFGGEYLTYPPEDEINLKPASNRMAMKEPQSRTVILGALLEVTLSDKRKHNQSSLISAILEKHGGIRGLSESGMQKVFAEANGALHRAKSENLLQ
ncbi:hypothetical protein [Pseudomonas juntendi]|uniref:hypothetical protein n=1 Tax=Pseudomonas juntendi TaxID=2666183 RepID=UPI00211897D0|nr:hypothetical protein [Pseudomonas juntendi]